jgi:hypothetical protein
MVFYVPCFYSCQERASGTRDTGKTDNKISLKIQAQNLVDYFFISNLKLLKLFSRYRGTVVSVVIQAIGQDE